ncbi:glycoside hydrolase family 127 protein [Maribacter litopenaei]|uniref:Glycoside hydrolase family 127 protein n=1 Tax=Maribacter litopenaei TaxID=2976127 RepID=A0ABY5YA80_9FLAO|nr:glycoside hydrolase family 127 protein [Maribacter litopenaei]UWX55947.1 glycoside hydrolase family 127 protein [Maribacter litopenaei]
MDSHKGMYGGDEPLHGTNPVQGVEFCSISEKMFSLETLLKITGDTEFADLLERIAYNALPAQASDDFSSRQYFQAANQIELSDRLENSFEAQNHKGIDFVYGVLTGYPCCTTNMHQSWPKYVQNLFYSTADAGVAALLYAPSEVDIKVADNVDLTITETTGFPFEDNVNFSFALSKSATFPFHLRIPAWIKNPIVKVNGQIVKGRLDRQIFIINRTWNNGDEVTITLPMHIITSKWHQGAVSIERGPLVYSLKLEGNEKVKNRNDGFGEFTEISTNEDWNFNLLKSELNQLPSSARIIKKPWDGSYPWNLEKAPIEIRIKATKFPEWKLVGGAPIFPESTDSIGKQNSRRLELDEITLIPYGCTTLRITEFPLINL